MLDKAQLSPDGKAKIKALLDLHNAIQFMSLEESEDSEERAKPNERKALNATCIKLKFDGQQ